MSSQRRSSEFALLGLPWLLNLPQILLLPFGISSIHNGRSDAPILIVCASVAKDVIVATGVQQALTKAFPDGVLVKLRFFNAMIACETTILASVFVEPPLPRRVWPFWLL